MDGDCTRQTCEVPEAGGSKLAAARPPAKPNYLLAGGSRLAAARPPSKPDFLFARGSLLASGALLACGTLLARPPAKPNYGKEGKCSQEYAAAGRSAAFMLTALSQLDSLLARPSPRWGCCLAVHQTLALRSPSNGRGWGAPSLHDGRRSSATSRFKIKNCRKTYVTFRNIHGIMEIMLN